METLEAINKRFSAHSFTDKDFSWTTLGKLITAAIKAPNSGNLQSFRFIIITDEKIKEKLSINCHNQVWIAQAPVIVVICSDNSDIERYYKDQSKKYAIQDASAAAENLILAAADLGIQSCWVSAFNEYEIKMLLKIPDSAAPHIIIPLGYSTESKTQTRHDMEFLISFNDYTNKERKPGMFPLIDKANKAVSQAGKHSKKFSAKLKEKLKR